MAATLGCRPGQSFALPPACLLPVFRLPTLPPTLLHTCLLALQGREYRQQFNEEQSKASKRIRQRV